MRRTVAVDTGGTFTDAVLMDGAVVARRTKVPSRRDDPSAAIEAAVRALGVDPQSEFALRHGTTVGTNALLEGRAGRVALITNAGFEDALWLGRQARPVLHALHPEVVPPPLERGDVVGLPLRVGAEGERVEALTDAALDAALDAAAPRLGACDAVAIALLHAYRFPDDERRVAEAIARRWPALRVVCSHAVAPVEREFERTMTVVIDAALARPVSGYLARLAERLPRAQLSLMGSAGVLMPADRAAAHPVHTALSGPAGGVRGALAVGRRNDLHALLTLDVGGTSTDVAVLDGEPSPRDDGGFGAWPLRIPLLPVETVGAGGGSLATLDPGGGLRVGPESAGAAPGPACYARGGRSPTVTDAHCALGRLDSLLGGEMPLDGERAHAALEPLAAALGQTVAEVARAIIDTADATIARACRRVSLERGHDPRALTLVAFGGAGGLHACAVAAELGCPRVLFAAEPGLLSADGMLDAPWGLTRTRSVAAPLDALDAITLTATCVALVEAAGAALAREAAGDGAVRVRTRADLRYAGQTHTLSVAFDAIESPGALRAAFEAEHARVFGSRLEPTRAVELVALHADARTASSQVEAPEVAATRAVVPAVSATPERVTGPARVTTYGSTLWVPAGWQADRTPAGDWLCTPSAATALDAEPLRTAAPTARVALSVHAQRMAAIAEEMGAVLKRCAFSANIKERQDYSCAVFDADGRMLVHAAHIPVHLGSTPASVRAAIDAFAARGGLRPGEEVLLNDPFQGGTHLPDVTLVTPVFAPGATRPTWYVANRAHHADVGGRSAGSLPVPRHLSGRVAPVTLADEGVCFGPTLLDDTLRARFVSASRTPDERVGDLSAQQAANRAGADALLRLAAREGIAALEAANDALLDHAERRCRALLATLPAARVTVHDALDDDGLTDTPVPMSLTLELAGGRARFDFRAMPDQTPGPMNAVRSIVASAVTYALACLAGDDMPANAGLLRPIDVDTRPGSLVDAVYPAGVSAGNVETSQRLVDLVFAAFAALGLDMPAASQGTMNNVLFGGLRPDGTPFVHYETLGGGAGARPGRPGLSGRQVHMTNTLNTPVEALERAFPVRVRRYALRDAPATVPGTTPGGRGVVREYEFLTPAEVTVLAERRRLPPPGLRGAPPGLLGRHTLVRSSGEHLPIGGKITFDALPRDRLIIETPGGGSAPQPLTDAEAPCSEP